MYIHVPFCSVRCGYCDFNTYTASELGGGASQRNYAQTAAQEILLARQVMDRAGYPPRPASTIFFGGGTPTLLPAQDLVSLVSTVRQTWGLADGAEVTTEANPDSVTPHSMEILANGGFTRVSLGMQSVVPHVLATLERTHNPANVASAVRWAHEAGLEVSVDLIYGTPGESMDDWRRSLDAAIATGAGHVSAYALTVEQGTRMAVQVRRGDIELPSLDDQADKYEVADTVLSDAGYQWYEISTGRVHALTVSSRCVVTTWRIGGDMTGGGLALEHTHSWQVTRTLTTMLRPPGCDGGTSNTQSGTLTHWKTANHLLPGGNCSQVTMPTWNG